MLKNAAQRFQRNVHQLLIDLPFAHFVYIDDVIVGNGNKEDHIRDLRCILQLVKDAGLLPNKNECVLGRSSIKCLGHIVDSQGISIPPDRVDDIKRFPRLKPPKQLVRLLGTCAFFHRFVPLASGKIASLTRLKNISRQKEFE